ncbi:MAG TPA: DUF6766 family protein [Brevundimonas sp.]|jgi:hypothetical protein|uniref:DUF6766 family protein n=1 Tax=Brevundimonas sp. TaxID=1871086 RepID=UPI002E0D3BC4|nr:DUF6766 family protein [Brevundimonas sp.]
MKKYAYAWLTLGFFAVSFGMHWLFGWFAYADEVASEGQAAAVTPWLVEMSRDTFENWQSEFLQLLWQVVGLAYFLYVGSPASKENDDRLEAKVDALLELVGQQRGAALIEEIDRTHLRRDGHAPIHRHPPYDQAGDLGAS